jgi:hypothetical protein
LSGQILKTKEFQIKLPKVGHSGTISRTYALSLCIFCKHLLPRENGGNK